MRTATLFLFGLLCTSFSTLAQYRHMSLDSASPPPLPKKILIIPAEVRVQEMSAGGMITKVPELTKLASENLTKSSGEFLARKKSLEIVGMPDQLSDENTSQLEDYLATFYMVGISAFRVTNSGAAAWEHKRKEFDYSLGRSLTFLKEKTGADAALMLVGEDVVSSGGRKTAAVLGALVGIGMQLGHSEIFCAMVDLNTGDLLWINSTDSGVRDLSSRSSVDSMLADMFAPYPMGK